MDNPIVNVVFLDRDTLPQHIQLKPLGPSFNLTVYNQSTPEEAIERCTDAHVVITNKAQITPELLDAAPHLKLVSVAATGYNNVDINACRTRNVAVCNVRNYGERSVPEHVLALMFALRRSLLPYHQSISRGRWQESQQFCYFDYPIKDIAGSTLGIIGGGSLGQSLAQLATALGMKVIFAARKGQQNIAEDRVSFDDLLAQADVISLHCPLTPETENLIAAPEFEKMVRKPILINTARGGLVNEGDLAIALKTGQISGAGVDVTTPEPPNDDNVLLTLMDLPNFIFTPHVAWASNEAIQALADQCMDNVLAYLAGEGRNLL